MSTTTTMPPEKRAQMHTLGELNELLTFAMPAKRLEELGIEVLQNKGARLVHMDCVPQICCALIDHLIDVRDAYLFDQSTDASPPTQVTPSLWHGTGPLFHARHAEGCAAGMWLIGLNLHGCELDDAWNAVIDDFGTLVRVARHPEAEPI